VPVDNGIELQCHVDSFIWPWTDSTPVLLSHGMSRNSAFRDPWIPGSGTCIVSTDRTGVASVAAAIIEGSDRFLDNAVTSLPVPVLLLIGGKNRDWAAEQRDMAAQLPHGEVEVIEGCSKGIFALAAAECASAALRFWARLAVGER
jgi:hypothetical protein